MAGKSRQRGISFFSLIFILAVLAGVGAIVLQALPSFLEYQAVIKAVNRAKSSASCTCSRRAPAACHASASSCVTPFATASFRSSPSSATGSTRSRHGEPTCVSW